MINRVECHHGTRCPYLNGGDVLRLIGERHYLSQRIDEMERVMSIIQAGILNGIEPLGISLALSVKPLTSFIELPRIRPP